jgi:hypothetical protein
MKTDKKTITRGKTFEDRRKLLHGSNIVEHIQITQDAEDATSHYYRSNSQFWRKLQKHIENSDDCIIERHGTVLNSSASSGVRFMDVCAPWCKPGEEQTLSLKIEVDFAPNEDDEEYDTFRATGNGKRKSFYIYYPADLELNFTEEKFKIWLNEQRKVRDAARLEKDKKTIKWLLTQCPGLLTQMVKDHQKEKRLNRS